MASDSRRVVILYSHPLFGEGLARMLETDAALDVALVQLDDVTAAEAAFCPPPDVVILERATPLQAIDLLRVAPNALLIDVGLDAGPSWAYRRDQLSPQPEAILRTIRRRCAGGQARPRSPRTPGTPRPAASAIR